MKIRQTINAKHSLESINGTYSDIKLGPLSVFASEEALFEISEIDSLITITSARAVSSMDPSATDVKTVSGHIPRPFKSLEDADMMTRSVKCELLSEEDSWRVNDPRFVFPFYIHIHHDNRLISLSHNATRKGGGVQSEKFLHKRPICQLNEQKKITMHSTTEILDIVAKILSRQNMCY